VDRFIDDDIETCFLGDFATQAWNRVLIRFKSPPREFPFVVACSANDENFLVRVDDDAAKTDRGMKWGVSHIQWSES
jgi:hypothetical protein